MSKYDRVAAAIRAPLPAEPSLRDFVRFATLAPNSHNTQPWTFRLEENAVEIRPDFSRRCRSCPAPEIGGAWRGLRLFLGLLCFQ